MKFIQPALIRASTPDGVLSHQASDILLRLAKLARASVYKCYVEGKNWNPKSEKKGLKKTRNGQKQARRNSPYFKISVSNFIQKRKKRSFEGFRTDKQNGAHCLVNVFVFFLAYFSFSSSPPSLNSLFGCSFPLPHSRARVLLLKPQGQKRVSTFEFDFRWLGPSAAGDLSVFLEKIEFLLECFLCFLLRDSCEGCHFRSIFLGSRIAVLYSV